MADFIQCEDFMDIDSEAVQQALVSEIAEHRKAAFSNRGSEPLSSSVSTTTPLLQPTSPQSRPSVVIVIDTNYFISHLRFLQQLLQILPTPKLLFFIPYVVLHELDSLKVWIQATVNCSFNILTPLEWQQQFERRSSSTAKARLLTDSDAQASKQPNLANCARQAITFLHKYLLDDHPGIRGQRVDQYLPGTNLSQVRYVRGLRWRYMILIVMGPGYK